MGTKKSWKDAKPAEFSAYLVTDSDNQSMPVGAVLIDKGKRLRMDWNTINFKTGDETFTTGVRIARLCAVCRLQHKVVGMLGHDGECGSEEVRTQVQEAFVAARKYARKRRRRFSVRNGSTKGVEE